MEEEAAHLSTLIDSTRATKRDSLAEIVEVERQIMLWERKIILEREVGVCLWSAGCVGQDLTPLTSGSSCSVGQLDHLRRFYHLSRNTGKLYMFIYLGLLTLSIFSQTIPLLSPAHFLSPLLTPLLI